MKKKLNRLHLQKKVIIVLNNKQQQQANGGNAISKPVYSCPITCGPTWFCPPPLDPTTDCY